MNRLRYFIIVVIMYLGFINPLYAQRYMEKLGRGVVAMRTTSNHVFVSWRMFGTDPDDISFNLYRNDTLIVSTLHTNYIDTTELNSTYLVKPVIDSAEGEAEGSFTIPEDAPIQPYISIPLQQIGNYYVHYAWVGDLDGDGEYDYIISRHTNDDVATPKIEAYLRDGTFLWRIDMGIYSITQITGNDNPPAAIGPSGNIAGFRDNDNLTVYDLDLDGKAEIFIRTADSVMFADSTVIDNGDSTLQYISVVDGMTGCEKARRILPNEYVNIGPLGGHMAVAYLDGTYPSLVYKVQNRGGGRNFNNLVYAFDYNGDSLSLRWIFDKNTVEDMAVEFHQIRVLDVDDDGKDEVCDGGYVVDDDGSLLYTLGVNEIGHGDRFHITDFDPARPGLEGYGIQQDNPTCLAWHYYEAKNGDIIQAGYTETPEDLARGTAADLNPNYKGLEYWTGVDGMVNSASGITITNSLPSTNFKLWWDGDLLAELLDYTIVNKWNYNENITESLLNGYVYGAVTSWRNAPLLHGDIMGDWREEIIFQKSSHSEIQIYTTTIPTEHRLYTLVHNPGYRNSLNCRGYLQSNLTDYYLGYEMKPPPKPFIRYMGDSDTCRSINIAPYIQINNGTWYQSDSATVGTGATIKLLPHIVGTGKFEWNGPNGYTNTLPSILLEDITEQEQGLYHVEIENSCQVSYVDSFMITIAYDSMYSISVIQESDTGFCDMEGIISSEYNGYTGNGYLVPKTSIDAYILWSIQVPKNGSCEINWRYANGIKTLLPASLFINDNEAEAYIGFDYTGGWDNWDYISANIDLDEGDNYLVLKAAGSEGLPNIDFIQIDGYTVQPIYCYTYVPPISNIESEKSMKNDKIYLQVIPNPVSSDEVIIKSNIKGTGNINLTLYNIMGKKIHSCSFEKPEEEFLYRFKVGDLEPGIFLISLERDGNYINDIMVVK